MKEWPPDCGTLRTMGWILLKKGPAKLHIDYAGTFTSNLYGHETRIRTRPGVEISFDLNPNLRTRSKSTNSYTDARELADGEITRLKAVHIDDRRIARYLTAQRDVLGLADNVSRNWTLTIKLNGQNHSFQVRPKLVDTNSLVLSV